MLPLMTAAEAAAALKGGDKDGEERKERRGEDRKGKEMRGEERRGKERSLPRGYFHQKMSLDFLEKLFWAVAKQCSAIEGVCPLSCESAGLPYLEPCSCSLALD
ncbi:hypothetical protein EYF80_053790 [Liparis tanakae]|uniref:Uncharacterized protein n=1 Tax=Liparis tanakae TaxID=230148 RepID=A0A4Z2F4H6_9TELE|nr:hypothetical protein EYF80_053790 [Liparis tanakae]